MAKKPKFKGKVVIDDPENVKSTVIVGENFERKIGGLDANILGNIFKRELV